MRAIFIIPSGSEPARYAAAATAAGASEIAAGIPPALAGLVAPADLPKLHVEGTAATPPTPAPPDPEPTPALDERLAALEELVDYLLGIQLDQHEEAP